MTTPDITQILMEKDRTAETDPSQRISPDTPRVPIQRKKLVIQRAAPSVRDDLAVRAEEAESKYVDSTTVRDPTSTPTVDTGHERATPRVRRVVPKMEPTDIIYPDVLAPEPTDSSKGPKNAEAEKASARQRYKETLASMRNNRTGATRLGTTGAPSTKVAKKYAKALKSGGVAGVLAKMGINDPNMAGLVSDAVRKGDTTGFASKKLGL